MPKPLTRFLAAIRWAGSVTFAVYLVIRLFFLIDSYSVNLLFWDNFNYYFLLAGRFNYWERFTAQLGPHREGFGMLLSSIIAPLSDWNMRAEAFALGVILTLALLVCLWMKKRAFERLTPIDLVVLPAIFLSPRQFEVWARTINSSHGVLPLFFVTLFCLCWTIPRPRIRDACILTVTFLAVFTGFGFFLGIVALLTFAMRRNTTAVLIVAAIFALFFIRYKLNPANPNFRLFDPAILAFPYSIALGLASTCGFMDSPLNQIVGYPLLAAFSIALCVQFRKFVSGETRATIIVSLIAFMFLFMLFALEGRISFGRDYLTLPRYIPLISPGFVGLYLSFIRLPVGWGKTTLMALAGCIAVSATIVNHDERDAMEKLQAIKLTWIQTYLATNDLDAADRASFVPIYPHPRPADFGSQIQYLRDHQLNFFSTQAH